MNQEEFLQKIKFTVLFFDEKAEVILFGSRARKDNKKDSDWDFLILTNKPADRALQNNIRNRIYDIELEYLQPVSTIIVDKNEWNKMSITGFYENVTNEGKIL